MERKMLNPFVLVIGYILSPIFFIIFNDNWKKSSFSSIGYAVKVYLMVGILATLSHMNIFNMDNEL